MDPIHILIETLLGIVIAALWMFIRSVQSDIKELQHDANELEVQIHKDFVTKEEWAAIRVRLHDLTNHLSSMMATVELIGLRKNNREGRK